MKKILTVHLKLFRSEEHYEYMIVFRDLALKMQAQPNSSFTAKAPTADAK
jgi:hypothetical protein